MSGSYDYYGPDGVMYKVDWYADETGFHPTLDHLPKVTLPPSPGNPPQPVEPNHPEVAAAVAEQLSRAGYPAEAGPMPCPQADYEAPLPA